MVLHNDLSECDKELVVLANRLLYQFNIPIKVRNVDDIGATVFVTLYEGLYGEHLPGVIRKPITREDEIHNCQAVIDSLAKDVLHISLCHIRGLEVIDHSREDISNLLEIFSGLSEYILTRIESDVSSENEDLKSVDVDVDQLNDPDLVTPEIIDDILDRELLHEHTAPQKNDKLQYPTSRSKLNYINDRLQKSSEASPGLDSTEEMIKEGEKWEAKFQETTKKVSNGQSKNKFEHIGRRNLGQPKDNQERKEKIRSPTSQLRSDPLIPEKRKSPVRQNGHLTKKDQTSDPINLNSDIHHTFTHHLYHHYNAHADLSNDSSLSASLPIRLNPQPRLDDKFRATVSVPEDYRRQQENLPFRPSSRQNRDKIKYDTTAKGLASSYDNLQNLVQSTATLARTAVNTSPIRSHVDRDLSYLLTSPRSRPTLDLEERDLIRDTNKIRASRHPTAANISSNSSNQSPGQLRRKVSFIEDRSSTDSGSPYQERRMGAPNVSLDLKRKQQRKSSRQTALRQDTSNKYGSYTDIGYLSDKEIDSDTGSDFLVKIAFDDMVDDVLSTDSDPVLISKRKRKPPNKQVHFEKILNKTGKQALAATRNHIRKETRKGDKRTEYLKKIYAEDYEDLLDEAETDIRKTKNIVRETEIEYKKKISKAPRKPSTSLKPKIAKGPGVSRVPLMKPVSTKVRKCSSSSSGILPRKTMLTVHDEEELLPVLLDEFPYLHMSQHTWHELMRRGITQIENITKAHEETKRKKSKSQEQIEEAARRHEVLSKVVRKQMESMNRVREAKEQKKQQLQFKNKLHEKRQQSVRARKYYNEYAVRTRSKLLRRRTKEEMIFKKLFKDGLTIQKERIQDIRQYAREQRDKQTKHRQDELDSMENYYHDQFEMLASKVATEREELLIREKAQQKALDQMKKELRNKMEKEIQGYQDQLFRDDDDAYFRQLDADRLRQELHLAKYQTKI